jgi:hypothetical protein
VREDADHPQFRAADEDGRRLNRAGLAAREVAHLQRHHIMAAAQDRVRQRTGGELAEQGDHGPLYRADGVAGPRPGLEPDDAAFRLEDLDAEPLDDVFRDAGGCPVDFLQPGMT